MEIPANFHFSQSSLQDFVDCSKRFYLRHIRRVAWPAVEAEPFLENERDMRAGNAFHRLVQQHLMGIPSPRLAASAALQSSIPALQSWWQNYTQQAPLLSHPRTASLRLETLAPDQVYPEVSLSAPLGPYALAAKYDLVLKLDEGRVLIFDWKTARKRPSRGQLGSRLQTRVYPYVLVHAGQQINGQHPFSPDRVEMIYWFAAHPANPEVFPYSQQTCADDEQFLLGLVAEIERREESLFLSTEDSGRCRFCAYRSLCDRGACAGDIEEEAASLDPAAGDKNGLANFDFEQIGEIEF